LYNCKVDVNVANGRLTISGRTGMHHQPRKRNQMKRKRKKKI